MIRAKEENISNLRWPTTVTAKELTSGCKKKNLTAKEMNAR